MSQVIKEDFPSVRHLSDSALAQREAAAEELCEEFQRDSFRSQLDSTLGTYKSRARKIVTSFLRETADQVRKVREIRSLSAEIALDQQRLAVLENELTGILEDSPLFKERSRLIEKITSNESTLSLYKHLVNTPGRAGGLIV
jgi:hypothetical protein